MQFKTEKPEALAVFSKILIILHGETRYTTKMIDFLLFSHYYLFDFEIGWGQADTVILDIHCRSLFRSFFFWEFKKCRLISQLGMYRYCNVPYHTCPEIQNWQKKGLKL